MIYKVFPAHRGLTLSPQPYNFIPVLQSHLLLDFSEALDGEIDVFLGVSG